MSEEKSTSRKVLIGVLIVVIGAFLVWLGKTYGLAALKWSGQMIVKFFTWRITILGWVFLLMCAGLVVALIRFLGRKASRLVGDVPPLFQWQDYTTDVFDGVRCCWEYPRGQIGRLRFFCPSDNTALVRTREWELVEFHCETCGREYRLPSGTTGFEDRIMRQIERKLRTDEWKAVVEAEWKAHKARAQGVTVN